MVEMFCHHIRKVLTSNYVAVLYVMYYNTLLYPLYICVQESYSAYPFSGYNGQCGLSIRLYSYVHILPHVL